MILQRHCERMRSNPGFSYLGSGLLRRLCLLAMTIFIFLPEQVTAAPTFDTTYFAKTPIQHQGRVKPLESFARHLTQRLKGSDTIEGQPAIEFLAEALFNPAKTLERPLLSVRNKDVKSLLNLDKDRVRFALPEVIPALKQHRETIVAVMMRDDKTWSTQERALMSLHDEAAELRNLVKSFQFILPLKLELPDRVAAALDLGPEETATYLRLKKHEERLSAYVQNLPEEDITDDLKAFIFQLSMIEENAEVEAYFRIMPPEWPLNQSPEWQSPWTLMQSGLGGPSSKAYLDLWQNMAEAYRSRNDQDWRRISGEIYAAALAFPSVTTTDQKLALEQLYQSLHPYFISLLLYGAALILCFITMFSTHNKVKTTRHLGLDPGSLEANEYPSLCRNDNKIVKIFTALSTLLIIGATTFHISAITMRMIILERPPVSTLYESVIFVSLVCILTCLLMAWRAKDKMLPLMMAAICGVVFHFVGDHLAKDGDTLQVLVAVLNTNFWLATHVIIITAGYGFCVITALLAHYYLIARAAGKQVDMLIKPTMTLALVSLLFTTVGTILGGIWADQSWGRFWGWDPKENGALLIVLWLIWLIHGRIAGQLKPLGFMAGMAFLNVIVALAWFGVNLLSVGLHSYGFISGIAWSLSIFCISEFLLIAALYSFVKQRERQGCANA